EGILRRPRSGSGQVRDVTAGQQRRTFHQPGRRLFRILSSLLLPGTNCLRGEWVGRLGPTEARSQERTQAHVGDFGIYPQGSGRRRRGQSGVSGANGAGAIWGRDSFTDDRARSAAGSKKTPLNPMAIDSGGGLITHYEDLRGQALAYPAGVRSLGYALFIR